MQHTIFSIENPKAVKARKYGYLNAIHYMSPHKLAGVGNLCPKASAGCMALCLGEWSGQAGMVSRDTDMNVTRRSRREKAQRFMRDRVAYMRDVVKATEAVVRKAKRMKLKPCVRLNGSTDIAWEGIKCVRDSRHYANLMEAFPDVQFVDYTKIAFRFSRPLPANYHLTFSRSETNEHECRKLLQSGYTVAVVFSKDFDRGRPRLFNGYETIDGDAHDLRHLDPPGVVVALSPKGRKAKADTSGFVVRPHAYFCKGAH